MKEKELIMARVEKVIKDQLEQESNRIGISLSKYIEIILKNRDTDHLFRKIAESISE